MLENKSMLSELNLHEKAKAWIKWKDRIRQKKLGNANIQVGRLT